MTPFLWGTGGGSHWNDTVAELIAIIENLSGGAVGARERRKTERSIRVEVITTTTLTMKYTITYAFL